MSNIRQILRRKNDNDGGLSAGGPGMCLPPVDRQFSCALVQKVPEHHEVAPDIAAEHSV